MRIAFRCDGDARVGAGHVARSIQLAEAFDRVGHEPLFVGRYQGLAGDLLSAAGFAARPAQAGPAGISRCWEAPVIVDSYEVPNRELERLAQVVPVAAFCEGSRAPSVTAVLHYHLSPPDHLRIPTGTSALLGPDYAPVSPRLVAARRSRGFAHALITAGGSDQARALFEPAQAALEALGHLAVFVAGFGGSRDIGLVERIEWADVAISAAGATAYELACAGVPTVAGVVADNQLPVAAGLAQAGAARAFDARSTGVRERLAIEVAALASAEERARLAIAGPNTVDGHGAARARDALLAVFAGDRLPRVLRYRPAWSGDARQLLAWRNDPDVRAASRSTEAIDPGRHGRWLEQVLSSRDPVLWIAVEDGRPVGSLRFDRRDDATAEISVSIAAERRGKGAGAQAIREATELFLAAHPEVRATVAEVRSENAGSIRAFERGGYRLRPGAAGPIHVLEATLPGLRSSPR